MIVSGEQQSNSAIYTHVSLLSQTPLPSRLLSYSLALLVELKTMEKNSKIDKD